MGLFNKFCQKRNAFTLIELLVVITIIGILSALIVVNMQDSRAKARNSKRKSDLHSIASALEAYYADYNAYPFGEGIPELVSGNLLYDRNIAVSVTPKRNIDCADLTNSGEVNADLQNKCNRGGGWLWELTSRGYIDRAPVDPINVQGVGFSFNFIENSNEPGLTYIYANDEPDTSACSTGGDYLTYGHAQRYKLFAALERPNADSDWQNDGGYYGDQFLTSPVTVTSETPIGGQTMNFIGLRFGFFYEVFSSGANMAFCYGGTNPSCAEDDRIDSGGFVQGNLLPAHTGYPSPTPVCY